MNLTHNGKIGRLPEAIREEVNVRLRNGETARVLCGWLNSLPEVRAVLASDFDGKPVREQNLSQWRKGGHQEWLRVQQAGKLMERLGTPGNEMAAMDTGAVLGTMTTFAAARYVVEMKKREGQGGNDGQAWNRMREFCHDVVALRRTEHLAQRLEFDREKYEAIVQGELKILNVKLKNEEWSLRTATMNKKLQ
jgi:hypothetical protein